MFRNLLSRLLGDDPAGPPLKGEAAEVSVAALMVRVARADARYDADEKVRIDRVLSRRCGFSMDEAADRRAAAEMIEAEAPDTVRFTRAIKERIALADRIGVIAALWEIAYADGSRGADEESLIRLVAGLLGVPDRDSALARQQVLGDLGLASD